MIELRGIFVPPISGL